MTHNNFVRLYELKAPAAVGLKTYLMQKYESLIECGQVLYEVEGVTMRILKLAFDPENERCRADFSDSEVMKVMIGKRAVTYTAMLDKKRVDERGTFVPRLCQNIIIENLTEEMADCAVAIKDFVRQFAVIGDDEFEVIKFYNPKRPKFFEGKVTVPVENIHTLSLKFNKMPGVKFCPASKQYVKDESSIVNVEVVATGFSMDRNLPRQKRFRKNCGICGSEEHLRIACPNKPPVKCFICGEEGHLQSECQYFRPRQRREFKCRECGAIGPKCSNGICANAYRINSGQFLDKKERMPDIDDDEITRRINRLAERVSEKRNRTDDDGFEQVSKSSSKNRRVIKVDRRKTLFMSGSSSSSGFTDVWASSGSGKGVTFKTGASDKSAPAPFLAKNKFDLLDVETPECEEDTLQNNFDHDSDATVVKNCEK